MISSRPSLPVASTERVYSMPLPAADDEENAGGISLPQILSILRAYRWHVAATAIALIVVSAIAIKLLPKVYVATATLIVNYENKDPLAGREFVNGDSTYIPTQIELMMSRVVLAPVVDKLGLTQIKEFNRGFEGPPAALNEVVTRNLHDALQIQQGTGSQLLYINMSAKEPTLAATIANAVADEYLRQARQRTNEPAGARAERYAQQLAELRDKTIAAQDRLTAFRQQHGLTETDSAAQADTEGAALADLQTKLEDAQNQRRQIESKQLGSHADSNSVLDATSVQALKSKLESEQAEMAELRATLGAKHPKVLELQSQMDATRHSLSEEVESISANNSVQLARARELEQKYQTAADAERKRLLERRALQDQSAKLVLELQSAQTTYKKALDGYDQIEFASTGNYNDVSLVSRADPPVKADKPNKFKLFALACLASLGVGVGWPFAYELFVNRRLRCRDDLERHFGVPVLAQLGPLTSTAG